MLATPTAPGTVIAGETLGRVLIAVIQAAVIILGSALLFGVRWSQPIAVAAVVILFALVGAGAGILLGTLFRNEQQAVGISLLLGLGLAALGGCMVPLEVFAPTMKRVAHLPPRPGGTTPSPDSSATAPPSPASCRNSASSPPTPPCC